MPHDPDGQMVIFFVIVAHHHCPSLDHPVTFVLYVAQRVTDPEAVRLPTPTISTFSRRKSESWFGYQGVCAFDMVFWSRIRDRGDGNASAEAGSGILLRRAPVCLLPGPESQSSVRLQTLFSFSGSAQRRLRREQRDFDPVAAAPYSQLSA